MPSPVQHHTPFSFAQRLVSTTSSFPDDLRNWKKEKLHSILRKRFVRVESPKSNNEGFFFFFEIPINCVILQWSRPQVTWAQYRREKSQTQALQDTLSIVSSPPPGEDSPPSFTGVWERAGRQWEKTTSQTKCPMKWCKARIPCHPALRFSIWSGKNP